MRARPGSCLPLLALLLAPVPAVAFHGGGVATCQECHVMHDGQDGVPIAGTRGETLLVNGNATDTCLRCHAAYGQFSAGQGFGPGGDFYWVTKTWSWVANQQIQTSPGDSHGHNLVAPAYGMDRDLSRDTAPGGTYRSADMGCTSCHDPHGNGNFRLLYGAGAGPAIAGGRFLFTKPAPLAAGIGMATIPGSSPAGDETDTRHTIFVAGISGWCANCHGTYHDVGATGFKHRTDDALGVGASLQYNRYLGQQDPTGGTIATSWWSLVPFAAVSADLAAVDPFNWTTGPAPTDRIMCLSCHRAHATPFRVAGRWDFDATLLADSHPATGDGGASATDVARRYYGYTFAAEQGTLCQKCHRQVPGPTTSVPIAP